jgi:hypothetical protein
VEGETGKYTIMEQSRANDRKTNGKSLLPKTLAGLFLLPRKEGNIPHSLGSTL